jgi:hypothetical protein
LRFVELDKIHSHRENAFPSLADFGKVSRLMFFSSKPCSTFSSIPFSGAETGFQFVSFPSVNFASNSLRARLLLKSQRETSGEDGGRRTEDGRKFDRKMAEAEKSVRGSAAAASSTPLDQLHSYYSIVT